MAARPWRPGPSGVRRFSGRAQVVVPDRRDMIWIDCNPQAGREMRDLHPLVVLSPKAFNETNPFAVKFRGPQAAASYILGHQPKSFDWRARGARPHPWKQVPEEYFAIACETLNQVIDIGR
jgi:mRNA interferase MazF